MEKKKFSIKLDTVLKLPNEVVTCRSGNDFVVISPKEACDVGLIPKVFSNGTLHGTCRDSK